VPLALVVWLRSTGASPWSVRVGLLLSLYLTTDFFLLAGLHHYRLALAAAFLALAAWEAWLRRGGVRAFAAWVLLLTASWLFHLTGLLFAAAGAAALALVPLATAGRPWRRVVLGALPIASLAAWQVARAGGAPDGPRVWGGLRKLARLVSPWYRHEPFADTALLGAAVAACGLLLWRATALRGNRRFAVAAVPAVAFVATYFVLPFSSGKVFYVDDRALPLAAAFAVAAALAAGEARRPRAAVAVLAVLVAAGNLAVLAPHLLRQNEVMRAYRAVAAEIPRGARVLPVATGPKVGHLDVFLHAGAFATLDAGATTPYLFSRGPTRYFSYRAGPEETVDEFWYARGRPLAPEARAAIADRFDYVLVKKPWNPALLPLPMEEVAESDGAVLLRIVRQP
jgi:hypothetical protein